MYAHPIVLCVTECVYPGVYGITTFIIWYHKQPINKVANKIWNRDIYKTTKMIISWFENKIQNCLSFKFKEVFLNVLVRLIVHAWHVSGKSVKASLLRFKFFSRLLKPLYGTSCIYCLQKIIAQVLIPVTTRTKRHALPLPTFAIRNLSKCG